MVFGFYSWLPFGYHAICHGILLCSLNTRIVRTSKLLKSLYIGKGGKLKKIAKAASTVPILNLALMNSGQQHRSSFSISYKNIVNILISPE